MVGINSAIFSQPGGSIGIGFAIPVNMVKTVIATAKSGGKHRQTAMARRVIAGMCHATLPIRSGLTAPPARSSPILSRAALPRMPA